MSSANLGGRLAPSGLPYLSVSQVEQAYGAEGCEFKWGQRYLAKNYPDKDGSALLGSRVHELNENFMGTGQEPNPLELMILWHKRKEKFITYAPGAIWGSGRHLLPPRHLVTCEGRFRFSTAIHGEPVFWQGAKDMEWQDPEGLWHIGDLKTTVSFAYQKTEQKLRADWQANLYAYEAMQRLQVQALQLDWFTYCTDPDKPRECRPTSITVLYPEVLKVVSELEEKGRVLLSHYQARTDFSTLTKNRSACPAFGGCPYRDTPACPTPTLDELFAPAETKELLAMPNQYEDFLASVQGGPGFKPVPPPPPWIPGDPLNKAQAALQEVKAPIAAIASAADIPPAPEVAATYKPLASPPAPLSRPSVESGFINPPEARGKPAPVEPSELEAAPVTAAPQVPPAPDEIDAMERDDLKAWGIEIGALDPLCRWQLPRMRNAVREFVKKHGITPPSERAAASVAISHVSLQEPEVRRIVREELRILLADKVREMEGHFAQR